MQRRRPTSKTRGGNLPNHHGRAGAFTRNMNRSSSPRSNSIIFLVMVAFLLGLFYIEQSGHHQNQFAEKQSSKIATDGSAVRRRPIEIPDANMVNNSPDEELSAADNEEQTDISQNDAALEQGNGNKQDILQTIDKIRKEFYDRYGGESEAKAMLEKGIISAAETGANEKKAIRHTAERILLARQNTKQFVMSFGGYSVTVGRGNYYKQSYPFIMEGVLKPLFEQLNLDLIVRNSAIGGIPSFPYGWCLPNFLGHDSDVVSWDYGMNEGSSADAFESYMRQSIATMPKRPMMILLDTKRSRVDMMKSYNKNGALLDSIAVGRAEVAVKKSFLDMDEKDRPSGFQKWDEWGAPKGSPGQSKWHPKKMEHELLGWMIAMHMLDAVEESVSMMKNKETIDISKHEKLALLPKPTTAVNSNGGPESPSHLLFGAPIEESDSSPWHMDPVSCRTSFLPNIHGGLLDIVVSGLADDVGDDLKSRDDSQYNSGWVIDVGKVERETKRKVKKVGGLGYIDMKNALYGIPESGVLSLSLPHEGPVHNHSHDQESDMLARHWFDTLVFCEVNEKRGPKECKPENDMTFMVGGVKSESVVQVTNAAAYLKKSICINVEIPADARVKVKSSGDEGHNNVVVELPVDVSITNRMVSRVDGACSISHVVWQSH